MSFGLPLRDKILKWQLVSRADSVSPVRGKKQQNQRTNISNIFEYCDERARRSLPERQPLHRAAQSYVPHGPAVGARAASHRLLLGTSWQLSTLLALLVQKTLSCLVSATLPHRQGTQDRKCDPEGTSQPCFHSEQESPGHSEEALCSDGPDPSFHGLFSC